MDAKRRRGLRDRRLPLAPRGAARPAPSPSARWSRSRRSTTRYPLYGSVALAGGGSLAAALAARGGLPGLVAEKVLVDRLGLAPGDVVRLGTQDFRLADTLVAEPDAAAAGFELRPAGDRAAAPTSPPAASLPRARCSIPPTACASPPTPTSRRLRAEARGPLRRRRPAVARPAQRPARASAASSTGSAPSSSSSASPASPSAASASRRRCARISRRRPRPSPR